MKIDQAQVYKEALRQSYKDSLFHTAREICKYPDVNERTHARIVQALEGSTKRKLICVPRGTLKSSVCTIAYPIWLLLNNPNLRILIDTEVYTNSTTYLREIKNILASEKFIEIFGDLKSDNWNEGEITISSRTKPSKESSITCGSVGTIKVGQHYDVIIGDDYSSGKNCANQDQRRKVIDHYQLNQSILEPDGIYVIVGTRYHEDDIIGHIIKKEIGFTNETVMRQQLIKHKGVYWYE